MRLPLKLAAILTVGVGALGVSACASDGYHGRGHGFYDHGRYDRYDRYDRHDRYDRYDRHDRRDHRRHGHH